MFTLLRRLIVSDADWRAIEHDLAELYEFRRAEDGERAARRWLTWQRRRYPLLLIGDRMRRLLASVFGSVARVVPDVRYSVRSLLRTPALTATIVLTVGIGLGATTGMLSVVQAVLLNPVPYRDSASVYWLYRDYPPYRFPLSVAEYRGLDADHRGFSAVAAYETSTVTVTGRGDAERVTAKVVTASYFTLLGQIPAIGRLFDASDAKTDTRAAVLTYAYWTTRLGADPDVVGRTITIDGTSHTIVGVLESTRGPLEHDVSVFTVEHWPVPSRIGPFFLRVLGRLPQGFAVATAEAALRDSNRQLFAQWHVSPQDAKTSWGLQTLQSRVANNTAQTLLLVLAAIGSVLLIACANAVNLLIARALGRTRELAIRGALGASRGRVLQHLLTEAGVLTAGVALVGAAIATGAIQLVAAYGEGYLPRLDEIRWSAPVVAWFTGLAVVSGLLIGIVPALSSTRVRLNRALSSGGRSASDAPAARRVRRVLVATEFALATPLLAGAVLVLTSLHHLSRVDAGIDTTHLLTSSIVLPASGYKDRPARQAFWTRALERLAVLPGVDAVSIANGRPPAEGFDLNDFNLEEKPTLAGQNPPVAAWVGVSSRFFETVSLKLERGRLIDDRDYLDNSPDVIVVDHAWALHFFGHEDVVGKRLKSGGCTACEWTTIIGVVHTVPFTGLDKTEGGTVLAPFNGGSNAFMLLRAKGDPAALTAGMRAAFRELDANLAVSSVATGTDLMAGSLAGPRYLTVLIGVFAVAALVLAVVGIYGVIAYFVQQHTRDLGIRLALGGEPAVMRRMVLMQGLKLVGAGVVLGVGASLLLGRLMTSALVGVTPTDPVTLTAVPLALTVAAILACLVPASRAARLDPAQILRDS